MIKQHSYLLFSYIIMIMIGQPTSAQEQKISLSESNVKLKEILHSIEKQADITFSFESSLLNGLPAISFRAKEEPLTACLNRLFITLPLTYHFSDKFIIIKKKPKQYTISGFVMDTSKETLLNASVYDLHSKKGSTSNNYGFYSLSLAPGNVNLHSSYVGFSPFDKNFTLTKDTVINIILETLPSLNEVVVEATNPKSALLNTKMGNIELSSVNIKSTPTMFGEADLIKTLQMLPGVSAGTEGLAGLYVRGGNNDENLFLIDGNPVYQINHLGGLFSAFNPDAVKNVEFYKGSFPARYGGRLSSVVDVRTKDGDMEKYHGSATIGLIAANLHLEGPIWKNHTSFNISCRRTYLDVFTAPAFAIINKKNENYKSSFRYAFHDVNAKINHRFSDRSRLYLSVYSGEDVLKYNSEDMEKITGETLSMDDTSLRWGNFISSLNWNYIFNNKLFGNASLVYSKYRSEIGYKNCYNQYSYKDEQAIFLKQEIKNSQSSSSIEDIGYHIDFDYTPLAEHHIKFGSDYLYHSFHPEYSGTQSIIRDSLNTDKLNIIYANQRLYAHEFSLYAEDDIRITARLQVNAGLRFSLFCVSGKTYTSLQPRLSMRYLLNPQLSVKASYARMSQYVHLLSSTYISLPTDNWAPVTTSIKPMISDQLSAGIYYDFNKTYNFSIEGYYKLMNNILESKDGSIFMPSFTQWDEKLINGKGRSYGAEFMVRKETGKTTGWIGYSLSWSDRQFPSINNGKRYPARYDNRHKLNIVLTHKLSKRVDISAAWTYASGNRTTLAFEEYQGIEDPIFSGGYFGWNTSYTSPNPNYDFVKERNNFKLADYHRLDLSLNIFRPKKKGRMGIWNVSIYNVYSRMNPFMINKATKLIDPDNDQSGYKTVFQQIGILPIIPSFSYTYKF